MTRTVRILVASPGDVSDERDAVSDTVNSINATLLTIMPDLGVTLEVVRWESHAVPSMGRAQAVINEQLGPIDIFVGLMATRFGTPTGVAGSGTEEEFRLAYDSWTRSGTPQIMFYFCSKPAAPPSSLEELDQLRQVLEFKAELEQKGLVWRYSSLAEFKDQLRRHLNATIARVTQGESATPSLTRPHSLSPAGTSSDDLRGISSGVRIIITDIGQGDAHYSRRENLLGSEAITQDLGRLLDGWWHEDVQSLSQPDFAGDGTITFLAMKFDVAPTSS